MYEAGVPGEGASVESFTRGLGSWPQSVFRKLKMNLIVDAGRSC